uniref:Chromatin modification-related protein n=1 Tax=Blastobotrys adeninivorans TaxID=409370 RepID=A0A060T6X1_BLAAD
MANSMVKEYDLYPGLNDLGDALEALPEELVRHFTLLREIEAKYITHMPLLTELMEKLCSYDSATSDNKDITREKEELASEIRRLIRELMPGQEEKMHVAGVASDAVARHIARIDYDFKHIVENEIPEDVQKGPVDHPAKVHGQKFVETRTAASTRSESRREAVAAKRAAQAEKTERTGTPANGRPRGRGRGANSSTTGAQNVANSTTGTTNAPGGAAGGPGNNSNNNGTSGTTNSTGGTNKRRRAQDDDDEPLSRPGTPARRRARRTEANTDAAGEGEEEGEPVYCYCQQVSYGEMVGCDGPDCKNEWFHLACIGLPAPPKGQWFCDDCAQTYGRRRVKV